ncbi:hypothetical protein AX17_001860 [Amanita inopinata Kibby_2008]|nr:hypothetical protein AX17_001860 [Amanita inopinata Kibby_2008]
MAALSLSSMTANSPRSRLPSLSNSSSSLSSTFSDVSFSSFSIPSPPPTSGSKTHAFFASPFSTRSHSPDSNLKQRTSSTTDVLSTPVPPTIKKEVLFKRPPSDPPRTENNRGFLLLDLNKDAPPNPFISNGNSKTPMPVTDGTPLDSFCSELTPQPTNLEPAVPISTTDDEVIGPGSIISTAGRTTSYASSDIALVPSLSASTFTPSSTSASTTSLPTSGLRPTLDMTLRLLRTLGQGTFSSVWLAGDLSEVPLSLRSRRDLRNLRRRGSNGNSPRILSRTSSINDLCEYRHDEDGIATGLARNSSLKKLREKVRGINSYRGKIRPQDGTFHLDERDGELGSTRDLTDRSEGDYFSPNDTSEVGLGVNLSRVGSRSGTATNMLASAASSQGTRSSVKGSGRLVAVKMTPRYAVEEKEVERERVAFVREVEILRHISHPNVAPLLSHLSTPTHYVLVFPYVPGGDLLGLVNTDVMWYKLGETVLRRIWSELCKAVGWMHGVGLVHRDIKLENILLATSAFSTLSPSSPRPTLDALPVPPAPLIKLSDFGLSRFVEISPTGEAELLSTRCGSEAYAAPELVMGGRSRSISAGGTKDSDNLRSIGVYDARETDAWACGVVLYTLVSRKLPFGEGVGVDNVTGSKQAVEGLETGGRFSTKTERRQWLMRIAKGEYEWPLVEIADRIGAEETGEEVELVGPRLVLSHGARRIVGQLLIRDPEKRARIADLWTDSWMKDVGINEDVDWDIPRAMSVNAAKHNIVDKPRTTEAHRQTGNIGQEKWWAEEEELEVLEKEEEEEGAWLVDEHGIENVARQELV